MKYKRFVQSSVTNFLYCGEEYLFIHRNKDKWIDAGRLNGIGGRVEPGENYLEAAIRETKEETGYLVTPKDIALAGVVRLEGGYEEDWIICFFKIRTYNKKIPLGNKTEDGELIWLHKDKVLDSHYELVDDLHYCFKEITEGQNIFFMTAQLNKSHKVSKASITRLKIL